MRGMWRELFPETVRGFAVEILLKGMQGRSEQILCGRQVRGVREGVQAPTVEPWKVLQPGVLEVVSRSGDPQGMFALR